MVVFLRGDLFSSKAHTLVNPVNCVGVMGKGIAKGFRDRWPEMFFCYQAACQRGFLRPGRLFPWSDGERLILNVPTKDHWRSMSTVEIVDGGLLAIRAVWRRLGVRSMAIPALGCGLGTLSWDVVRPLIEQRVGDLPFAVEVYEPL